MAKDGKLLHLQALSLLVLVGDPDLDGCPQTLLQDMRKQRARMRVEGSCDWRLRTCVNDKSGVYKRAELKDTVVHIKGHR